MLSCEKGGEVSAAFPQDPDRMTKKPLNQSIESCYFISCKMNLGGEVSNADKVIY